MLAADAEPAGANPTAADSATHAKILVRIALS